jgi:hypothetical protein
MKRQYTKEQTTERLAKRSASSLIRKGGTLWNGPMTVKPEGEAMPDDFLSSAEVA